MESDSRHFDYSPLSTAVRCPPASSESFEPPSVKEMMRRPPASSECFEPPSVKEMVGRPPASSECFEPPSAKEMARAAWAAIANEHRSLVPSAGQDGAKWSQTSHNLPSTTAQEIMWELIQDLTFDSSFLMNLLFKKIHSKFGQPSQSGSSGGEKPCCKFCRNNNEEDIYHAFKDADGLVLCPVLSKHVCDLCGISGPLAHTRKYCPKNLLTHGCPEEAGFPPGMLPKDVYETTQLMMRMIKSKKSI